MGLIGRQGWQTELLGRNCGVTGMQLIICQCLSVYGPSCLHLVLLLLTFPFFCCTHNHELKCNYKAAWLCILKHLNTHKVHGDWFTSVKMLPTLLSFDVVPRAVSILHTDCARNPLQSTSTGNNHASNPFPYSHAESPGIWRFVSNARSHPSSHGTV